MIEEWKEIKGYEGLYEVSSFGRVRNSHDSYKRYYINNKGYCCISLYKNAKGKHFLVHRLVADAFIPKVDGKLQINHIDGDKTNNHVDNLEWCDQHENYDHGMDNFFYSHNEDHYFAKLSNDIVRTIPTLYRIGFIRTTIAKILGVNTSSIEAIEKGISYRELGLDFSNIVRTKYKDLPNIQLPSNIRDIFVDNTVLNTLIAEGKVSV